MSLTSQQNPLFISGQVWDQFDEVIDVRTPAEFDLDHIPGAINLPVLSNEERVTVGTLYKQTGTFEAKKLGAALIAKNVSSHLLNYFQTKPSRYSTLIYCWRGGQRSQSLGLILQKIGFQAKVLQSGYKGYRRNVVKCLETLPQQFEYKVLCGLTGAGKTERLHELSKEGYQTLDLESLARHRGSLLGELPSTTQPSQKLFDSRLAAAFIQFDQKFPVWIESEGQRIGRVQLPKSLWEQMRNSSCVWLHRPLAERAKYLIQTYEHFIQHPSILKERLGHLVQCVGKEKLGLWFHWIEEQKWQDLVEDLLTSHYDKSYLRALRSNYRNLKLDN